MALLIEKSAGEDKTETIKPRRPLSPSPDLIDFSFPIPPLCNNTIAADEVFRRGRLLPSNISSPPPPPPAPVSRVEAEKPSAPQLSHRRAGSLDGRTHRTSDYQRLRRASSDPRPASATGTRQKLPLFVIGSVRFPAEMEMKDIRSRQRRHGPPATAEDGGENAGRKSRWGILRALSCKAAENTAISPVVDGGRFCPEGRF